MTYKNSRVDIPLTNLALATPSEGFICEEVFPELAVNQRTGIIPSFDDSHLRLIPSRIFDRGSYALVNSFGYDLSETYLVNRHGLKDIITDLDQSEISMNPMSVFNALRDATIGLKSLLMIEKEYEVSQLLRNSDTFDPALSETIAEGVRWDKYDDSSPLAEFARADRLIAKTGFKRANAAIIPWEVARVLKNHPDIVGRTTSHGRFPGPVTDEQLKQALGYEHLLIPFSSYVPENGQQVFFWGNDVLVYHRAPSPQIRQRTLGFRITQRGRKFRTFQKEGENPNSINIFMDADYVYRIVSSKCGYLFKNTIG